MPPNRPRALPRTFRSVVPRARLQRVVEERFERPFTVLVAGAGLGKTTLMASVLAAAPDRDRVDVWFPCRVADASASSLAADLLSLLGSERTGSNTVEEAAGLVIDALWYRSPSHVCLVFDDGHLLPQGGDAEALVTAIAAQLPPNGHLLFASRRSPPFPLTRQLALGEAVVVDGDALRFTDEECVRFAEQRGTDAVNVLQSGGWPALAELMVGSPAADARPKAGIDFVWEEVLGRISSDRLRSLRLLALAGSLDSRSFASLTGSADSLGQVVEGLPLVSHVGHEFRLHDIWTEALLSREDSSVVSSLRRLVADHATSSGDFERAFHVLAEGGLWKDALPMVRSLLVSESHTREPAVLQEWLARMPPEMKTEPEAMLLEGLARRGTVTDTAVAGMRRAVEQFAARHDADAEIVGLAALSTMAINRGDSELGAALYFRVLELSDAGSRSAQALLTVMQATVRLSEGFADDAVQIAFANGFEGPHSLRGMSVMVGARCLLESGRPAEAIELLDTHRNVLHPYRLGTDVFRTTALWQLGRHGDAVAQLEASGGRADRAGREHDRDLAHMIRALFLALCGSVKEAEALILEFESRDAHAALPFVRMNLGLARGAIAAMAGDDDGAGAAFRSALRTARFLNAIPRAAFGLLYVAVEEQRVAIDDAKLAGVNALVRDVARAFVAARNGDLEPAGRLPALSTDVLRSHFAAPWLVELAIVCEAAGNRALRPVLDQLGSRHRDVVRRLSRSATRAVARAADSLLPTLPVLPPGRLSINVIGTIDVSASQRSMSGDLTRERVRALLVFLVIHRTASRDRVASLLWPELDAANASNNLRTTLNYLQRTLEPGRRTDEPPFFLRQDGPTLVLVADPSLEVDFWEFERRFAAAVAADASGEPMLAVAEFRAAAALWRGELGTDVVGGDWLDGAAELARSRFVLAGTRAGELLAGRDDAAALALGLRVREVEPWSERVHMLVVRAHRGLGDLAAARRALDRWGAALDELGVEPSDLLSEIARELGEPTAS